MVGIGGVVGIVASFYGLAGLWIWNGTRSLWNNYGDDFDQMKTYRASKFRQELHEIVMDVLNQSDYEDFQEADEPEVVLMDALESIDRDSLTDIEDALRKYDEPNELIDEADKEYESAVKNLGGGFVSAVLIAALSVVSLRAETQMALQGLLLIPFLIMSLNAAEAWYSAWKDEKAVDKAIREYKNDY